MSWATSLKAAGALGLSTLQLLARLLYVLLTPIRWCLQYFYASIVFLLSPIRVILSLGLGTVSFIINLIARLKLACATIIGICAGCMLHGTSSFLFVLLGMDTASERQRWRDQQRQRFLYTSRSSVEKEDKEYYEESSSSASWRQLERRQHVAAKVDPNDLFEKRWKLLRTPEQPRRRRKGLLAQTIHEESSESDF
ncbi:hypothetical protein FHL15_003641 [Xylaria flabelliformis]|uniref:Uncharacterized protein n=1 Tax=Xylaria flabelliformis TaxID=2512241 RepID=A0A553I528_9PEZI|nr:hypothetical protein FHL15_003641 [Xylaria flabelliformis]